MNHFTAGTKVNLRRHGHLITDAVITGETITDEGREVYTFRRESNGAEGITLKTLVGAR